MKKSLLGSFLLFLALFAQAQDARTVFINMPDSLMPLLTKVEFILLQFSKTRKPTNSYHQSLLAVNDISC